MEKSVVLCRTKSSKGFWKEFQSDFKVQGFFICHIINYTGYNQKWNVSHQPVHTGQEDRGRFPACDGHDVLCLWPSVLITCPKFDNLLPELELSISVLCVNVVSCSVKGPCFRWAGTRDLIYDVVLFSWGSVEFWLLVFRCSNRILICLTRSDPTSLTTKFWVLKLTGCFYSTTTSYVKRNKIKFTMKINLSHNKKERKYYSETTRCNWHG